MLQKIFLILTLLAVIGCSQNIIEYDSEKMELDQAKKIKQKQADPFNNPATPDYVKVADDEDEGVYIEVMKLHPIKGPQNIKLDVWNVQAVNRTLEPKCVGISWKLQDFEFESEQPMEFLLLGKQTLHVGKMKQSIWSFDGAMIAIPPSGYVDDLKVRKAVFDTKSKRLTCEMEEKDIQDPVKDDD